VRPRLDCKPWYTDSSVSSRIVLIGPADALPALQERLDPAADIQTFTDSEALEALDHIMRSKPALVAMQDEFSATSRGLALINRIKDDPNLRDCEVRVMARDAAQNRVAVKRGSHGSTAVAIDEPKPALDQKGTRRAPRTRIKDGVEVAIDGNPAKLVDLSGVGAQIVSPTVLKPNQRVRVVIGDAKAQVKCAGAVAWAAFEMPKGMPTRYRAGIDFGTTADRAGLDEFAKKNKKD
jgi:CheY-like chemotaxis protein